MNLHRKRIRKLWSRIDHDPLDFRLGWSRRAIEADIYFSQSRRAGGCGGWVRLEWRVHHQWAGKQEATPPEDWPSNNFWFAISIDLLENMLHKPIEPATAPAAAMILIAPVELVFFFEFIQIPLIFYVLLNHLHFHVRLHPRALILRYCWKMTCGSHWTSLMPEALLFVYCMY